MPIFGASQFEKLLAKATDEQVIEPDWMAMMAMCDMVRQQEATPNAAISSIRKQLFNKNSQVVINTLLVLECLVKNCSQPIHEEITQYEFLEDLKEIVRTGYTTVRSKVLALIASWYHVFKNETRYIAVKDVHDALKAEGFQFPEVNDAEDMFDAARAPEWEDGRMCHLCRQQFSMTKRKHHCRNCGQIFCAECSNDRMPLPHFGIEKEVRVCSICASKVSKKPISAAGGGAAVGTAMMPNNPQPAVNPQIKDEEDRKNKEKELELKEKEELDLAIALSLSQQESRPSTSNQPTAVRESAPVENLYSEPVPKTQNFYPDLSEAPQVVSNGLYPHSSISQPVMVQPAQAAPASLQQPIQQPVSGAVEPQKQVQEDDIAQQVKDLTEMLMRRLNQASIKGEHVGMDPHIQTLLASLTALHPKLVTKIEETERKKNSSKDLLTKIMTCREARESLDRMREEHLSKVRQQEEEQATLMRLQMEQKLELLRQQKLEQLRYQEELKRRHEQALIEREVNKTAMGYSPSGYSMPSYPVPQQYYPPQAQAGVNAQGYDPQYRPQPSDQNRPPVHQYVSQLGQPNQLGPIPTQGGQSGPQIYRMPNTQISHNANPPMISQSQVMPPKAQPIPQQVPPQPQQVLPQVPPQGQLPPAQSQPMLPQAHSMPPFTPHGQQMPRPGQLMPIQGQPIPPQMQAMPHPGHPMPQGQPMLPQGQPVPPHGQPMPPQGQPLPAQGQPMHPQGQPPVHPQGQPMPPQGQPMPPQGQPMPPQAQANTAQRQNINAAGGSTQPVQPIPQQRSQESNMSSVDIMDALNNAPAPPTETLSPQRREEPAVADLISL